MEIDFLIFPHVEELDVVGAFEIFGKVKDVTKVTDVADDVDISSLKVMASTNITVCAHGLSIVRTHELNPENKGEILVVPGGKGVREHTNERSQVITYIQETFEDYQFIVSVCTGAFLLAEAGALTHVTCTTHTQFQEELRNKGYSVVSHRIVHQGKYITSMGVTSGIDASLYMVYLMHGRSVAEQILTRIEYPFSVDHILKLIYRVNHPESSLNV